MYEVETKGMNFQFGNSDSSSAKSGFVYLCLVNLTMWSLL